MNKNAFFRVERRSIWLSAAKWNEPGVDGVQCRQAIMDVLLEASAEVNAWKEAWINHGERMPQEWKVSLLKVLSFTDKGLDVFAENLAWNTPSLQSDFVQRVTAAFLE
jgi:hypothetical protein